jgi:hypothetical protein
MNESLNAVDTAPAAVDTTPDTPTDLSEVITNSLDGLENRESDDTLSATPDATPDTAPDLSSQERDELAEELGLKPGSKNNRIPYNRVKSIVKKAEERLQQQIQERDSRIANLARYEAPEVQQALSAFHAIEKDPKGFLDALAQADQRYAELLRAPQAQAQPQSNGQAGEIHPDVLLSDGTLAYSPEAMQRLLDARAEQVERRIEQKFEEKFGPVANDWRQNQLMRGAVTKAKSQIAQAEGWVGFNDHKADILAALKSDPNLSLEQAYILVVTPRLTASRDDIRKQVLAEVATRKPNAARGSIAPGHAAAPPRENRSIEDVIKDSIAGLPRD